MGKRMIGAILAGAMMFGSTAAVAAESSAPVAGSNPWATLSMISSASTAASFCGSSAAIAGAATTVGPGGCVLPQVDAAVPVAQTAPPRPIPVPPVEPVGGLYFDPLLLGIGAVALAALVYFVLIKKGGDSPNSPD